MMHKKYTKKSLGYENIYSLIIKRTKYALKISSEAFAQKFIHVIRRYNKKYFTQWFKKLSEDIFNIVFV